MILQRSMAKNCYYSKYRIGSVTGRAWTGSVLCGDSDYSTFGTVYICVLGKKVNVHRYTDSILRRYWDESRIMQCHENCRDSEELLAHTLEVYNVLSCKYFVMKRNLLTTAPIASSRFVAV